MFPKLGSVNVVGKGQQLMVIKFMEKLSHKYRILLSRATFRENGSQKGEKMPPVMLAKLIGSLPFPFMR